MGERISTERAQELVAACALTADDLRFVHPDGTPIGCTYSEGDRCRTCGGAHMVDLNDWGEHLDGCAAAAVEMRVKPARRALGAAAEAALLDLIAARERIAALEVERDARVTVEEHARAVRKAFWSGFAARCVGWLSPITGWKYMNGETPTCYPVRTDLLATLTRHVGPERAAALADGVE